MKTQPTPSKYKLYRTLLALLGLMFLVACTGAGKTGIVVTEIIMENGEEVVVTRFIEQTPIIPVTATPAGSSTIPHILDIGRAGSFSNIDPQKATDSNTLLFIENLFVGLTTYNQAENRVEPALATSWTTTSNGLIWTFHLKPDVFWVQSPAQQDTGTVGSERTTQALRPIVADDVVYAVERLCDPQTLAPNVFIFFIIEGCAAINALPLATPRDMRQLGVTALDSNTVQFRLTEPAAHFLSMTTHWQLRPIPRDLIATLTEDNQPWFALENVPTSGPFVISTGSSEDVTVFERNPFWTLPYPGNVDQVAVYWLDQESSYTKWEEKELDISPLPIELQPLVSTDPVLRTRLYNNPDQAVFYLAYNLDSSVFSDASVRRAFGAAVDRQFLIKDVYGSLGLPMRHLAPPGVFGAPPLDVIGTGFSPGRAILEMANSQFLDCRFMPPIRYMVGPSDQALFHAETLRDIWKRELNCPEDNIQIEQVSFGTLLESTQKDAGAIRPDIWDLGWASFYPDAHNWLFDILHCQQGDNRSNRPCSEVDTLLEQARASTSSEQRITLYHDAERLFFSENGLEPISPLYVEGTFILVHPWVTYEPSSFGGERLETYLLDAPQKALERQQ